MSIKVLQIFLKQNVFRTTFSSDFREVYMHTQEILFSLFRNSILLLVARWLTLKFASQTAFWELVAYKQVAYKKCTLTFVNDCKSYTTYLHFDYLSNSTSDINS